MTVTILIIRVLDSYRLREVPTPYSTTNCSVWAGLEAYKETDHRTMDRLRLLQ